MVPVKIAAETPRNLAPKNLDTLDDAADSFLLHFFFISNLKAHYKQVK